MRRGLIERRAPRVPKPLALGESGLMATTLRDILERYRAGAKTEREKGTYFERLVKVWLENAPTQREQFSRVLTFAEWAAERREDRRDAGIDLCAELADEPGSWCAVQCKFYAYGHKLQKGEIDSFFTESGKAPFVRRIIVDTTGVPWSPHAEAALNDQHVEVTRVGLSDLDESGIDWSVFAREGRTQLAPKKEIRPHQREAMEAVRAGLAEADRGKLIMACGTGKTFTALKIAEDMAGAGGRVLYLVPSLALMSQTVREWSLDSAIPLRSFAVCSDSQVGVQPAGNNDLADMNVHDLEIPATTLPGKLTAKANKAAPDKMTVVFSTYQSIQVLSDAQKKFGLPEFDLIVCDEAHRTTGVTFANEDESAFVRVHRQDFLAGKKRIYMTATPRIYGEGAQAKAREVDAELASMDDASMFGETLFTRNFGWAVQNDLLTDYKVIVLAVDEEAVSKGVQKLLSARDSELLLDDATKMVGCYKALSKADFARDEADDTGPMHRALAFTRDIKSSKLFKAEFAKVATAWRAHIETETPEVRFPKLAVAADHVDGSFNASSRGALIDWLKAETDSETCRILSNARCLSEGVDVPALDAIIFLHPRKSQVDVVQAVGRVMRKAAGKKLGYVILPVGVPAGVAPEQALDNNEKYKIVWQILNALRAHDERLDATINKIELGVDPGNRIEVIAVTDALPDRSKAEKTGLGIGQGGGAGDLEPGDSIRAKEPEQLGFEFDEFKRAIQARIVKKCGRRAYWEDWAKSVAEVAQKHIVRLKAAVEKADSEEKAAFDAFLTEIRDDLNESITAEQAIEMLAQHMVTRPVFEALFENYSFASKNPVSQALQGVLDVLDKQSIDKEARDLKGFYDSIRMKAAGIEDAAAKQRIVKDLYDKFFRTAFPKLAERMGIVYTPIEVVDFIVRSVDEVLRAEFGQTLGSKGVHIIDPFTGTGTFITRLLQSGLISKEELAHKYANEIHANEILLLAYYIAAINIEAAYHELSGGDYQAFPGICLTDTFQLYEKEDLVSALMTDNSTRRSRQRKLPIRVIVGNPPYSEGQESGNDNLQNVEYPTLDQRIRETYGDRSTAGLQNSLFNSYVRAIRWASDRIGDRGVIGFVSAAGWITGNSLDGMRKVIAEDFTSVMVFHLRGNQRTKGELSRKEGGKIFGSGSRSPIAITILIKNPNAAERGRIQFHDIGDYLSKEQKLSRISQFESMEGITAANGWSDIVPNEHGDWLGQRDESFSAFIPISRDDDPNALAIFSEDSSGIKTNRDSWCYNSSRAVVASNMERMIDFYNSELDRYREAFANAQLRPDPEDFVDKTATKIKWTREVYAGVASGRKGQFKTDHVVPSIYRPFFKEWAYFDGQFNNCIYQMPRQFPSADAGNVAIVITGPGAQDFSAIAVNCLPNYDFQSKSISLPRYIFPSVGDDAPADLLSSQTAQPATRIDGITDAAVAQFRNAYPGETISKDDLFYYVYGILNAPDYVERYADNLRRELPRMPILKRFEDFRVFVDAGRRLAELHVNYDAVEPYPVTIAEGDFWAANIPDPVSYFRVEKMKFGKRGSEKDKTVVIYNPKITITNIPPEAYDYVVNGKPALEWVMERQGVKTDPASGIVNDANRYANETVGDPRYPFDLFCRVITVSLETMKIVRALPALDIRDA